MKKHHSYKKKAGIPFVLISKKHVCL